MSCARRSACPTRLGTLWRSSSITLRSPTSTIRMPSTRYLPLKAPPSSVSIVYEKDGAGLLRISDNAMGMSYEELIRRHACRLAA